MNRGTFADVASGTCLFVLGMGVGGIACATPDVDKPGIDGPTLAVTRSPAPAAGSGVEGRWRLSGPAAAGSPGILAGRAAPDPLQTLAARAAGTPGRIAAVPASWVPLEENPRVDWGDALGSVLRSTAAAVPGLHLGAPLAAGQRAGQGGPDIATLPERATRFDDLQTSSAARPWSAEQGGGGAGQSEALPQLSREVAQFARELLANPLAWMVGLFVLMVAVTVTVIQRRDK